jgi:hypothetical protein
MEEELNTTRPDLPNYVGPDEGKAIRDPVGDVVTAGLAYGATQAITPIAKILGPAGIIDAGINIATGESDTAFEKKLELFKPAKVAVKGTRLLYENLLEDVFDNRILDTRNRHESITRFSTLQKQTKNKNILDEYVHKKAVEGPFKNWEDQGVPQSQLTTDILDSTKRIDAQLNSPEPAWRKTPRPDEKKIWMEKLADEIVIDHTGKHISKRTESGYKFLGKFRAEWNKWSKDTGFIQELADKPATAFVEHLTGKDKYYDRFWALPNELRFRKGSRHSPNNVRILYGNRMKSFKDASETILKEMHNPKDVMDFILLDYDIPKMKGRSITVKQSPRDLLVKRVDGKVIGRLGDYHDILYASDNPKLVGKYKTLSYRLGTHINPKTGKPYINLNASPKEIAEQITEWRGKIIRDKLQLIIDQEPTLKGTTKAEQWQRQGKAIEQDMVEFLDEYAFIEPAKGFRRELKQEPFQSARGGKPIKTKKDKLEGIFLNKTQEREIMSGKRKKYLPKELLDNIFGIDE